MFTHDAVRHIRRSLLTLSLSGSIALGVGLVSPAAAETPAAWEQPPEVRPLEFLLLLVIFPLALAAVITLLTVLPSMARDTGYEPGQSWRGEPEWFGGPTKGVKSADEVTPEQIESRSKGTGGTSASW